MSLCILSACSFSFDLSYRSEAFYRLRLCMSYCYFSYKVVLSGGGECCGLGSRNRPSSSCWSYNCIEKKFFLWWTCVGMPLDGKD